MKIAQSVIILFFVFATCPGCAQEPDQCLASVKIDGKYGYINQKGEIVISCRFRESSRFTEGLAEVIIDTSFYGYIDSKGERKIDFGVLGIATGSEFNDGIRVAYDYHVEKGDGYWREIDRYGYIDKSGKMVIELMYDGARKFSEGLGPVHDSTSAKWGFIDLNNNYIINAVYQDVISFSEGLTAVKLEKKWGVIDNKGSIVVEFKYDSIQPFHEGLAAVKKDEKYGFINKKGETIIDFKYDLTNNFSEGVVAVNIGGIEESEKGYRTSSNIRFGGTWGYIDKTGKEVIPIQFLKASDFRDNYATVAKDSLMGIIDSKGEYIIAPDYLYIGNFFCDLAVAYRDGKYGYIDLNGKWVIPPKFERASDFVRIEK